MKLHEREPLLAKLKEELRVSRRKPGRLVLVVGEAGIGKTTLVDAFCAGVDGGVQVLWGACDPAVPPRPFAPLADIADTVGGPLKAALDAADRDHVFAAVLALLRQPRRSPPVVVFEDVHWADEATLDLLRVVGRRLRNLPVLVVATYRDDEVAPAHPLRRALGDVPAAVVTEMRVPALSLDAVAKMTGTTGLDPVDVHRSTRGNPFFVTELISAGDQNLPPTVRDAVLARSARLSGDGQRVLHTASVLGQPCRLSLLREVAARDVEAVAECVAGGMLEIDGEVVRFRHDLVQQAVYEMLPLEARTRLHRRALHTLTRRGGDSAALARHAVEAGDADAVLESARAAGDRAAKLGAHVEAAALYASALRFAATLEDRAHARLLEAHGRESMLIDDVGGAITSQEAALEYWRRVGDIRGEGECLRALSEVLWFAGMADRALETAELAVELLETVHPMGAELARAYAALAQRRMARGLDDTTTLEWAARALALAERLGEEQVAVHALATMGVTRTYLDDSGWTNLEESLARALDAGFDADAARAFINLLELARDVKRYDIADRYQDEALRFLRDRDHDLDLLRRRLLSDLADLALDRGQWDRAADLAAGVLAESPGAVPIRIRALTVVGRLRARRGERDPWAALDEGLALAVRQGEAQDLCPVSFARAEAAWLEGDLARTKPEAERALSAVLDLPIEAWWRGEAGFWAWKAGLPHPLPEGSAEPWVLHVQGRCADAARAWKQLGCPFHEALALADSTRESDLRTSLELSRSLGAERLAGRVAARLRELGARKVPRGPRAQTRANPAGLTRRELDVLELLAEGLRNSEIAARLVLSAKTVDHHVSAILRKLGVPNRAAAAEKAKQLLPKDRETEAAR
ncbi:MAG TPA: AAA family ATPase [Gaiellaceae bacterium]|nr:AAA family ATPase [Gaiellaceae bacterium]